MRDPVASGFVHLKLHLLAVQLRLQFHQELVDHRLDDLHGQRIELHDGVQPVTELGGEHPLDHLHGIGGVVLLDEPDRGARGFAGAGIRRHDEHGIAEIRLAPVVVGQRAVVHDLQQDVEHLRMGLFDLVQQDHAVRMLGDRLGQ